MENNEDNVSEEPSTHSKKAQLAVLFVMAFLLILVTINAVFRAKKSVDYTQADNRTIVQVQKSPAERNSDFNSQFERADRDQEAVAEEPNTYEEIVAQIKESKTLTSSTLLAPREENKDTWADDELKRVRESRYDDYSLNLKPQQALGLGGNHGFNLGSPASPLDAKRQRVAAELARANALLDKVRGGGNVTSQSLLSAPTGQASGLLGIGQDNIAGQALSTLPNNQPLAGQKLLPVGSIIRAAFDQKVMSDYVGSFRLRVTQDVYDVENKYVLIPKGSIASCTSIQVQNVNEPIQARMGYMINYMVLPDGKKIDFSRQAGLDREGVGAVKDKVNRHLFAQFLGVVAYALVSDKSSRDTSNVNGDGSYGGEIGGNTREIGSSMAQKYLSLVPTITLRAGTNVRIFIEEEVFIFPWETISDRYVS